MTVEGNPPCSVCHEDYKRGYNTICLNIGGQKTNIDLSDREDCEVECDTSQKGRLDDGERTVKSLKHKKEAPCCPGQSWTRTTAQGMPGSGDAGRRRQGCKKACRRREERRLMKECEVAAIMKWAIGRAEKREAARWKTAGPPWYTVLSDIQLEAVDSLALALKRDIEEGGRKRTLRTLSAMGLTPMPTVGQLQAAMLFCIVDVKSLKKKGGHRVTSPPGSWSAFDGLSNHALIRHLPLDLDETTGGGLEDAFVYEEEVISEWELADAVGSGVRLSSLGTAGSRHCCSSTAPHNSSTEDDYGEEADALLPETRWCDWCGECNTHCAAYMPAVVCEEEERSDEEGEGNPEETSGSAEEEEPKKKCDWCGECTEHCFATLPPVVCDEKGDGQEATEEVTEQVEQKTCEWCGACTQHCPSVMPSCEEEETAGEETEGGEDVEGGEDEEGGQQEEEGGDEAESAEDEADNENPAQEEGAESIECADGETEEEDASILEVKVNITEGKVNSRKEKRLLIQRPNKETSMGGRGSKRSLARRMTRAPLEAIIPFDSMDNTESPLEIQVDPVEFLFALYMSMGEHGGRVWESSFPQRDRLLLTSAAHLQLPRTFEWLEKLLPRRLRTDNKVCDDAGNAVKPKRKSKIEKEAARLKIRCKEATRRHGKSPYLTFLDLGPDYSWNSMPSNARVHFGRTGCKDSGGGDGNGGTLRRKNSRIIVEQVMDTLKRVAEEFGDPVACLPFAWKLPEVRLWIDKRRRNSVPKFASRRPRMTADEIRKLIVWSKIEWSYMTCYPYEVKEPRIPAKLRNIRKFNMSHFNLARRESEKIRHQYFTRLKRAILEETRDYWVTMSPYASHPVPWNFHPQKPPPPREPPTFRRVFSAYLPTREKDILI